MPHSIKLAACCAVLLLASACDSRQTASAPAAAAQSPVAAMVDQAAISQAAVNAAVPAEDQARRAAQLENFVAEQLLANAALSSKLDQDPVNSAALEAARRQVLARAYVRARSAAIPKPAPELITQYFNSHPELFAQRRIYRLQEINVKGEPARMAALAASIGALGTFELRAAELKKMNVPFTTGVGVKPAESLPADLLRTLNGLPIGAGFTVTNPDGISFMQLTGSEPQPLTESQAKPAIERYLMNISLGKLIGDETRRLRGQAKISYSAPYSAPAPAAPGAAKQ